MFWQFEDWNVSQIDKILDSPDVTLEQVLAEGDVIQECKAQNEKLVRFLTQPEIMRQMINLIITVPDEALDPKLRFKNANVACELLTCDLDLINDALIEEEHLKMLYSFIETSYNDTDGDKEGQVTDSNQQLNPLLASFVSKTFCVLINKRPQGLFDFLRTKDNFVTDILSHIEVSAMTDLLLRLMTGTGSQEIKDNVDTWLSQKKLIPCLVNFLDQITHRPESQFNATQLLCDFIRICREQQSMLQEKATPNPLLQEIESSETVDNILRLMFECNTDSGIVQGIRILQSLIEYQKHNANLNQPPEHPTSSVDFSDNPNPDATDFEGIPQNIVQQQLQQPVFGGNQDCIIGSGVSALDASRLAQSVCQVHAAVLPRLSLFHDFLSTEPPIRPIPSTIGLIQRPLGSARIEVVHFIRALLSSNNPSINRALSLHKTLSVLVALFFKYPWNSFLHTQVEQSIKLIFINSKASSPVTSPTEEAESNSRKPEDRSSQEAAVLLVQELIQETCLIEDIPKIWSKFNQRLPDSDLEVPINPEPRPGYMGHLIKIANDINDAAVSSEDVRYLIDGLSEEKRGAWKAFVENSLSKVNERMKTPLVPEVPATIFEKEATQRQESVLHQAFIQYQMQQMTKDLGNESGVDTSSLREARLCVDSNSFQERSYERTVQISRLNFNLEDPSADQVRERTVSIQMDQTENENSSSDEEDIWPEKNIEKPTQVMEVDVVADPWTSPNITTPPTDPWSGSNDANQEGWADFGSFQTNTPDSFIQPIRDSTSATSVIVSNVLVTSTDSASISEKANETTTQVQDASGSSQTDTVSNDSSDGVSGSSV